MDWRPFLHLGCNFLLALKLNVGICANTRIVALETGYLPAVNIDGIRVISFKPKEGQIKHIEKRLGQYLKAKQPHLFAKYNTYHRQYFGVEIKGDKQIIRGNFLCSSGLDLDRWKSQWIETDDGGDCFFQFTFDLKADEIVDFDVNDE